MTYLGRYLKGGPISNSRIIDIADNKVTFNIGRKKRELLLLAIDEFIDRLLKHVPQSKAVWVRSYGCIVRIKKTDWKDAARFWTSNPSKSRTTSNDRIVLKAATITRSIARSAASVW